MRLICLVVSICAVIALAGCANFGETKVSMPYVMQVDRTDQYVEGNRGYLQGAPPPSEDKTGRKRPFIAVNIDLPRSSKEAGIPDTKMVNLSEGKTSLKFGQAKEQAQVKEEQIK